MAELGTVQVNIQGDWQGFEKQSKTSFGKVAGIASAAFAAAFVGKQLFDFGKDAVNQASDLNESINAVAQTFDSANNNQLRKFGEGAAQNLGIAKSEFNAFAVQFGGFAKQISADNPATVVEEIATRAADFASVMNLDVADAGQKFQSIMAGSSEVARMYGLDVSSAAVEQFALENKLWDGKTAMTESMKTQARYALLMQQTEQWSGDFAETSDELANSQRIAAASFKDAKAELGAGLLPILGEFMTVVRNTLIPALSDLQPAFQAIAGVLQQLLPIFVDNLVPVIIDLVPHFTTLAGIVAMAAEFFFDLITPLLPLVMDLLPILMMLLDAGIRLFKMILKPISELLVKLLTPLIPVVSLLAEDLIKALWPAIEAVVGVLEALNPLIDLLLLLIEPLLPIIGMLAQVLGVVLAEGVKLLTKYIGWLIEKLTPLITFLGDLFSNIRDALADVLPGILDFFTDLPNKIWTAVKNAGKWLLDTGKNVVQGFIDGIKSMAGRIITTIKNSITNVLPGFVKDALGIGSPSKVFMGFGQAVSQGMALGIERDASQVLSAAKRLVGIPGELAMAGTTTSLHGRGNLTQNFYAPVGGDMGLFAKQMADAQARESRYQLG
jgi:hypothetical protein